MLWKQEIIKALNDVQNLYFFDKDRAITNYKQVALSKVTGSRYDGMYVGWTWQYMRDNLKRSIVNKNNCYNYIDFPLLNGVDEVVLEQFGDEFFIVDGHHRICIARFMGRESVVVKVQEHPFDHELFALFQHLQDLGYVVNVNGPHSTLARPLWELSLNEVTTIVAERAGIATFIQYCKQVKLRFWDKILFICADQSLLRQQHYYWPEAQHALEWRQHLLENLVRDLQQLQ